MPTSRGGSFAVERLCEVFAQEPVDVSGGILPPLAVEHARALPREFDEQPDEHMPQHFAGIRVGMGVLVVKPSDLEINPAVRVDQVQQIVAERLLRPEIRAEDRKEAVVVVEPGEVVFDRFLQEPGILQSSTLACRARGWSGRPDGSGRRSRDRTDTPGG